MKQLAFERVLGLLAIGESGTLWTRSPDGALSHRLVDDLDADTPLALGTGRIAARLREGGLWTWTTSHGAQVNRALDLAVHAGLLWLPAGLVCVVRDSDGHRLVRVESIDGTWRESARSLDVVTPDARPVLVALDPKSTSSRGDHVLVLGGPDSQRYTHGVLGDAIEATRVMWLDRHDLRLLRELSVAPPYVIEDIKPRPVAIRQNQGVLTIRSDGLGAQLVIIAADPLNQDRLSFAALGNPLGAPHRWLAPITDGRRILAVHTPHIGGILNEYRLQGSRLMARTVADGVANHQIGARNLDLSIWVGSTLIVPGQNQRTLRFLDSANHFAEAAPFELAAQLQESVAIDSPRGFAVLLKDGVIHTLAVY